MKIKNKRIEDFKLKNFAINLITHKQVTTYQSVSFLKMVKIFLEPLITRAKVDNLHNRRLLLSKLYNQDNIIKKLFELGQENSNRPGGYLRIVRLQRKMDGSSVNLIEFVNKKEDQDDKESK